MIWYDCLEEEYFLGSIYDVMPELTDVRINRLELDNQRKDVNIVFEMPRYCDKEPLKWQKQGFNIVVVNLHCCIIRGLMISLDETKHTNCIDIKRINEDQLAVRIKGNINMKFDAEVIMIEKVSGYQIEKKKSLV